MFKSQWVYDVCSALRTLAGILCIHVNWRPTARSPLGTNWTTFDLRRDPKSFDLPESAEDIRIVVWGWTTGTELLPQALSHTAREVLILHSIDPLPQIAGRILDEIGGQALYRLDAIRISPPTPGN